MNLESLPNVVEKRIPSLDGLRAFSILLVIIGHARSSFGATARSHNILLSLIGNQHLGVSYFFVISGFLITKILINELQKNKTINLRRFYARRVFRILPAFYFFLIVILALSLFHIIQISIVDWISAATFTWNYNFATKDWWVGHSWSLSVEEQFYLIWPALLVFTGIKGAKKWVYALIIVTPLIRVASYFIFPEWRGRLSIMLHTRIDTLMVGCLLALTWEDSIVKKIMNGPWSKLLLNISLFFLLIVSPLLYQKFAGSYLMTIGYSLESVCIVWSIAWFILFPESKVGVILNSPVVMRIGVLSYSLYIWQQLFLTHNNYSYVTEFPLNVIMVYLMAEISYRFIEKPFLNFKPK